MSAPFDKPQVTPTQINPITRDDIMPREMRLVGYRKICWVLNLSKEEVQTLVEVNIIPYAKNLDGDIIKGRFDLIEVVQAVITEERNRKGRFASIRTLVGKTDMAKFQRIQAITEREVIHNEMMKGTIVRLEDVDAEAIDMLLALRTKLLGYPSHVARLILGREDFDEVCAMLTKAMEEAMVDLKPFDHESIRARNRKLSTYTDAMANGDDEEEAEPKRPVGRPKKDA